MIWRIFRTILLLLAIAIGLGYVLPDDVRVEREIVIDAPADAVFALVGDLNEWGSWSPWVEKDPGATFVVTGAGVGQTTTWVSENPEVGRGSQTVTALEPPSRVKFALAFDGMGEAEAAMLLSEAGGQTTLTWMFETNMRDGVPLLQRPLATYFGFFMDGLVGADFERGLVNVKRLAEGG